MDILRKRQYGFLNARPLQVMNSLSIINQLGIENETDIFIPDMFEDAKDISRRLSECFPSINIVYCDSYNSALDKLHNIKYNEIFIPLDVGFRTSFALRRLVKSNRGLRISVFEEGLGTYRSDIYSPMKRGIFKFLGLPVNAGGSRYTSRIFVYDTDQYSRKSIRSPIMVEKIESSLVESIEKNWDRYLYSFDRTGFLKSIVSSDISACNIYLSSWNFNPSIACVYVNKGDFNIIKPHPNCKTYAPLASTVTAPASLPAEILILVVSKSFERVRVAHHGSSTPRYIKGRNIDFINVSVS